MTRRIALACLTPRTDGNEHGALALPSYGIRRIQAAVVGDMLRPDHVVRLFERSSADIAGYVNDILAFEPDILGMSIYVWSTDCMVAVAREIKRRRPQCLIVFGGPSARSAIFDMPFYRDPNTYLDVMVEGDGELIFRDIARLPDLTRIALNGIGGLTFPDGEKWKRTVRPNAAAPLDLMPSAFQLALMPPGSVAYLETFRGCPLSCRFCEWGAMDKEQGVFSSAYIARELRAFRRAEAPAIFLLDSGLNLNAKAFRNFREAAAETGVMKEVQLWAEIYPSSIRQEHLDFLQEIGPTYLGVGMQSADVRVLKMHQRMADSPRFEESVRRLAAVTTVELQIIMALPGDTPDGFRRTLDYAMTLPAGIRVYHCLVLPDALMTRGLPEMNMIYDPRSLAMESCLGWSRDDILSMRNELAQRGTLAGGKVGSWWWSFPHPNEWQPHRKQARMMPA
jgi:radical SAM superfamily enzyme YgiQ (UPF0313 family)